MKRESKVKLEYIHGLISLLKFLSIDYIDDELINELSTVECDEYEKIIDIAYKSTFANMNRTSKIDYGLIINKILSELTDDEIESVFEKSISLPIDGAENANFIKNLLIQLKSKYCFI